MCGGRSVCVLMCVFCFCCALKRKHVFSIHELTVTGKDLRDCGKQKVCVTSSADCPASAPESVLSAESFVNTSCHFLIQKESLTCRWAQLDGRAETSSSFIFTRSGGINRCPSILHFFSRFNLTIKSTSVIGQKERFSDVYPVVIEDIVQAPRPVITSVNVTHSSVSVTWTSGNIAVSKCRIRYKRLNTESWTQTSGFPLLVVEGLQAFSEYHLSVSCIHDRGRWSDWSEETRVKTSESRPVAALSLSYRVASEGNSGVRQLLLLWKALDVTDARGLIRRYEVSYYPTNQPFLKKTVLTAELKAVVVVRAEEYEVSVWAYNSAGRSPDRSLRIDASLPHDVRSVKALWVYSDGSSLRIRWDRDSIAGNASEFAIEWSAAANPDPKHWQRVDGSTLTTRLPDIKADETYNISVFPIYGSLCGPPTSISASLQHGALLDLVRFGLVNVTRSSLAVEWMWTEAKPRVNVLQYRLVLEGADGAQSLTVFPDKQQHTFHQLHPNARYSVYIQAETATGNFSKASLDVNTPLIDYDEMMRFAVPVLLLLLVFGIFSVSSMTLCRKHVISNPRYSLIGRWLLDPHLQGNGQVCVLKLESVFPLEQQKSFIRVERRVSLRSEHEDAPPSEISPALRKPHADAPPSEISPALRKPHGDAPPSEISPALRKPHADARAAGRPEDAHLPSLAEHSDYVQNGQIVSQLYEKSSD